MKNTRHRRDAIAIHHLVGLLGVAVLGLGLWLSWQLERDAKGVEARAELARVEEDQGTLDRPIHEAQRALVRAARAARLQDLASLVEAMGLCLLFGAGIFSRVRSEIRELQEADLHVQSIRDKQAPRDDGDKKRAA